MIYNHPIGSIYHLYTTYILPSGGVICYLPPIKGNQKQPLTMPDQTLESFNFRVWDARFFFGGGCGGNDYIP